VLPSGVASPIASWMETPHETYPDPADMITDTGSD
jgi:hypothetical protein